MSGKPKLMGHLRRPSAAEVQEAAARENLKLSPEEAEDLLPFLDDFLGALDEIEEMPELSVPLQHTVRDPGRTPTLAEDPLNAFTRLCRVEGSQSGPLFGKTIGVKDNIAVAGVPVSNGSRTASYVPTVDATVVERALAAGATVTGKLNMDDFASSGFGETSVYGPPRNPRNPSLTAGGSSGGAGSAVASGAVDMALAGDQGGSGRIPAAMCGCVALKPTYGLVPLFGSPIAPTFLDYICPMAMTVEDVALLLGVIAGPDWRESRTAGSVPAPKLSYIDAASAGVGDLKIGVVKESLDESVCEPAVLDGVTHAIDRLEASGAAVTTLSIPSWMSAFSIWTGVWMYGMTAMLRSDGFSYPHLGYVDAARVHAQALSFRGETRLYPPLLKLTVVATSYIERNYFNTPFARVANQRLRFKRMVDEVFQQVDILLTPTSPRTATPLREGRVTEVEQLRKVVAQVPYTAPLNLTGHPALALPSNVNDQGLPTSVQIIAREFAEFDVFRVAFALESLVPAEQRNETTQYRPSFVGESEGGRT